MEQYLATTFIIAAKAYWIDGEHDQTCIEGMFKPLEVSLAFTQEWREGYGGFVSELSGNQ